MTKETKVGLLVGLAFIILFAIILSEKGATNNVSGTSAMTVADSGQSGGSMMARSATPLAGDGKLPIDTVLPSATPTRTVRGNDPIIPERPVGMPIPKSQDDIQPLPKSVIETLNYTPMPEREIKPDQIAKASGSNTGLPPSVADHLMSGIEESGSRLVSSFDHEEAMGRDESREQPRSKPIEVTPVKIIANHKVKSGESLGKIAARYYGRSTPSRVNAIFDVNRDRLASIHAVRVGDVLRIPAIPDADGIRFVEAPEFKGSALANARGQRDDEIRIPVSIDSADDANTGDTKSDEPAPIEFKWYEVRENDTLSRIAQEQMGSARMYLKLYDVNRDLLPNKNSIKPGMKIRIPVNLGEAQVSSSDFSRSRRDGADHRN